MINPNRLVLLCVWLLMACACHSTTPTPELPMATATSTASATATATSTASATATTTVTATASATATQAATATALSPTLTPQPLEVGEDGCIEPVYPFAYQTAGRLESTIPSAAVLPPDPWVIETTLPEFPDEALEFRSKDWLLAAFSEGQDQYEIWVLRSWANEITDWDYEFMEILVYNTGTKQWKTISPEVFGTEAVVGELFMTEDGSIWAHNYWGNLIGVFQPPVWPAITTDEVLDIPILSKYNKNKERFEPVYDAGDIPAGELEDEWNKVILDENGVFWVVVQGDGIYSYTPENQAVQRHADIPYVADYMIVRSVSLAPNGDIFLSDNSSSIYRFFPETGVIDRIGGSPLPFNNKYSIYFHGIQVDHSNRLWIGDVGWVDLNSRAWYQLVRSSVFIDTLEDGPLLGHERPWIVMESVDGRLWYTSYYGNGMTWLDPQQEKWCWFTTEESNIVEDEQHNLWIIADNKLYRLDIEP